MLQKTHPNRERKRCVRDRLRIERKNVCKGRNLANLTPEKKICDFSFFFLFVCIGKKTHTLHLSLNLYHCKFFSSSYSHNSFKGLFFCSSRAPCSDPFFWFYLAGEFSKRIVSSETQILRLESNPSHFGIILISLCTLHTHH